MRQEIFQMKTSPRMAIGYNGPEAIDSPNKTISDAAFSIQEGAARQREDERATMPDHFNRA